MTQAREPDTGAVPECPFPLNSVVTCGGSAPLTVIGWYVQSVTQARYVQVRYPDGEISGVEPDRLVTYAPLPEPPPLRVGDWVRGAMTEFQITTERSPSYAMGNNSKGVPFPSIEPPVGWPVGVPTEDGGTRWYVRPDPEFVAYECRSDRQYRPLRWADLLAAGGVPALAVTR